MFSSFNLCLIFFLVISTNRHCDRKHASMSEYLASRIFENVTAFWTLFSVQHFVFRPKNISKVAIIKLRALLCYYDFGAYRA